MIKKIEFQIIESGPGPSVPDPAEPVEAEETSWGTLVGLGPTDPDHPYGLEISVVLRYGDSEVPLIQEFLDKFREMEEALDEKVVETD